MLFLGFGGSRPLPAARRASAKPGQIAKFPAAVCSHLPTGCCYYPPNKPNPIHRPFDFPHVADIASIREGPEQQVCRCCFWPSMASGGGSAACWARRKGKSCHLGTRPATNVDSLPDWLIMHRDTLPTRRPQPHKSLNPQPQRQTRRLQAKHHLHRSRTTSTPRAYPPRTCL